MGDNYGHVRPPAGWETDLELGTDLEQTLSTGHICNMSVKWYILLLLLSINGHGGSIEAIRRLEKNSNGFNRILTDINRHL